MIDVEPLIRTELEQHQPLPLDEPHDWDDVVARAKPGADGRPARRPLALAFAALLAVAVAGAAYAIDRFVLVGDPAPPAVKASAARFGLVKGLILPGSPERGAQPLVDRLRAGAVLDASTGPVYLWVAPSSDGGYCAYTDVVGTELPDGKPNLAGGCTSRPGRFDIGVSRTRVRDGRLLSYISGRVASPTATRLVLELPDAKETVALTGPYFLAELPVPGDAELPAFAVEAQDSSGRTVDRREFPARPFSTRPRIDLAGRTPLIEIPTRRTKKPIRLYVFESEGTRCSALTIGGTTGGGCGRPPVGTREIGVSPNQIGSAPDGTLLLWGEVGREIASLELRFEDGRVEPLPLVQGWTLYQVAHADYADGRRPQELVGRDAAGKIVARRAL